MKKTFILLVALVVNFSIFSQGEGSAFTATGRGVSTTFATDYQALGINPANLGWSRSFRGKTFSIGFLETGFGLSSKLINNKNIVDIGSVPLSFNTDPTKSYNDFKTISDDLSDGFAFDLDSRLIGFAFTTKRGGGFAFGVTERYKMSMTLSNDFSDILVLGFGAPYFDSLLVDNNGSIYNIANSPSNFDSIRNDPNSSILAGKSNNPKLASELLNGTSMKISWIREFNFSYGRQIISNDKFGLYGGIGVKYFQGMAVFDLNSSASNLSAFYSYSPTLSDATNPGFFSTAGFKAKLPKAAGTGFGLDLGLNALAFKRMKFGFAVTDLGSITWKKNTLSATSDSLLNNFKIGGLIIDSASGFRSIDSILNNLVQVESRNFERTIKLPATMRFGASIQIGKILEIGGEMIAPLNSRPGSFKNAIYSIGGDLKFASIRLSSGIVFHKNEVKRIPAGIVFSPLMGMYEIGISTRDVMSLIKLKERDKPMISAAFGFLRFRF